MSSDVAVAATSADVRPVSIDAVAPVELVELPVAPTVELVLGAGPVMSVDGDVVVLLGFDVLLAILVSVERPASSVDAARDSSAGRVVPSVSVDDAVELGLLAVEDELGVDDAVLLRLASVEPYVLLVPVEAVCCPWLASLWVAAVLYPVGPVWPVGEVLP
jgi:hypothetical protein